MNRSRKSYEEKRRIARMFGCMMVANDWTLQQIVDRTGYPLSSIYVIMMNYLPALDYDLYKMVRERLDAHKKHGRRSYAENVGKDRLD